MSWRNEVVLQSQVQVTLSCIQLHKKAERIAIVLSEKAKLNTGQHVALLFPPGLDLIAAFYGCLYAGEYCILFLHFLYHSFSGHMVHTTLWFKKTRQLWRTITTTQFSRF